MTDAPLPSPGPTADDPPVPVAPEAARGLRAGASDPGGASAGEPPDLAVTLAGLGSDIALVLDDAGVILRMAVADGTVAGPDAWVGRSWADTVTGPTRGKIEQLLRDVASAGVSPRREVNHPAPGGGQDIPVSYAAVRLGPQGPVLAAGRDLRSIAAIQQRFIASQQELERGYWQLRQAESRYRLLFQVATDAVCVLDLPALRIVEANQSAAQLFGAAPGAVLGTTLGAWLDRTSAAAFDERLSADSGSRDVALRARLLRSLSPVELSATRFHGEHGPMLLLRARAIETDAPAGLQARQRLADVVDRLPDAVLVTDAAGRVLSANPAFVAWTETPAGRADDAADEARVRGRPLAQWLRLDAPHTLDGLVQALRHRGLALALDAHFHGEHGHAMPVHVTAVLLDDDDRAALGFTLRRRAEGRDAARAGAAAGDAPWPRALDALTARLGLEPAPALLDQARAELERHFGRLALAQCGGDALAAARWLAAGVPMSVEAEARAVRDLLALASQAGAGVERGGHPPPPDGPVSRLN